MLPVAMPARGVYLLTPDDPDTGRLAARLAPLLAAGPALLQYRNKAADAALRRAQLRALLPLCAAAGVPLLVNDDWRLAADEGAAGAHLGSADGALADARQALGADAILGASCYASPALAAAAARAGASYLAFGACFPSGTKPGAPRAELSVFADAASLQLPRVAIGGITADNAPRVIAAGADFVAVIGAVFDAPDPLLALRALLACFARDGAPPDSSFPPSPHA